MKALKQESKRTTRSASYDAAQASKFGGASRAEGGGGEVDLEKEKEEEEEEK